MGGACSDQLRTETSEARQYIEDDDHPGPTPGPKPDPVCPAPPAEVASAFPPDLGTSEASAVGTLPGSFSVTPSGDARYTMPLVVPPGRAGLQPSLSVVYDSLAGDGPLGVGFSITGQSVITRCPKNMAQDGEIRPVMYDTNDSLCLDGRRLVLVGQSAGIQEFRTFPDTFVKVLAYFPGNWDPALGPQTFSVLTKEGLALEYGGATENGRAVNPDNVVRAWWMTKTTDRSGNFIQYEYLPRNEVAPNNNTYTSELVLKKVNYTGHAPSSMAPSRSILFDYEQKPANATRTFFTRGVALRSKFLLMGIRTFGPGNQFARRYRFRYETSTSTGRKRLMGMKECTADLFSTCKPETTFSWSTPTQGFQDRPTQIQTPESTLGSVMPMDVTGDGLDDLVLSDAPTLGGSQPFTNLMVAASLGPSASQPFDAATLGLQLQTPPSATGYIQPELGTPIDYNHDGLMDLFLYDFYVRHATWRVLITHPDGTFSVVNTGIQRHSGSPIVSTTGSVHLADVNGDGMTDLIECKDAYLSGKWSVHLWTDAGPGFSTTPIALPTLGMRTCDDALRPVDIDADGRAELVTRDFFLDGNGYPIYTNSYVALSIQTSGQVNQIPLGLDAAPGSVIWLDVNGDSLPDAIETGFGDRQFRTFLNTGSGFTAAIQTLTPPVLDADELVALGTPIDWDGDGMQDLLLPMRINPGNLPSWTVLRSRGNGQFEIQNANIPFDATLTQSGVTIADPRGPRVIDADGDGAHDVLLPHNGFFHVFRNLASEPDVLLAVRDGMNPIEEGQAGSLSNVSIEYTTLIDTSITKGAPPGSFIQDMHSYVSRYDAAKECAYPVRCVVGPRRVVSSYAVFTGATQPRHFRLRYRDGRWHRLGRGFLGFGERIVDDLDKHSATIESYDNVTFDPNLNIFPFAGRPEYILRWNLTKPEEMETQPIELGFTSMLYQTVQTSGGASYFTIPVYRRERHEVDIYEPPVPFLFFETLEPFVRDAYYGLTSTRRLSESIHLLTDYDQYGNALAETTFIGRELPFLNPAAGADTIENVDRTFENDTATWQIGLLKEQEHCSTVGSQTACRTTKRTYDAAGRAKTVGWGAPGDNETKLTVTFGRDTFGNITKTVAVDAFEGRRATCTSYEPEGVFPYAQRNAEGHLTLTKFNPQHGGLQATIDPNALTTRWAYDGFGRETREVRPDGTETAVALAQLGSGIDADPWKTQVTTTTTGAGTEVAELDPLGRVVRTLSPGVATAAMPSPPRILREVLYDIYGEHVDWSLVPIAENAPQNQRHYDRFYRDGLGRVRLHVSPWGGETQYAYEGETVRIEDPRGNETVTNLDSLGRPMTITDAKGETTTYAYGPFGMARSVAAPGSPAATTERDAYGRVRFSNDPVRGMTELHYSGFGDLWWSKDALGREMRLYRDRLGRVDQRSDIDTLNPNAGVEITRWAWDTAPGKGIGQIATVTSPAGHIERFTYDGLGRPATEQLEVAGETFAASFAYDPQYGRLATTTTQAPGEAPFVVAHDYDATGHLLAVRDPAAPPAGAYWTLTATDGAGRITGEKFGNNVTTTRSYFADKDRVESISTQSGATPLQNLWYTYDDKLNLGTRSDYVQLPAKTETFSYDALDRLECASFDALNSPCERKWEYLENGNLHKAPGSAQYDYEAQRPLVLKAVGAALYAHDAVGNQISRPGVAIEYTPFDLPKRFTLASGQISFDYSGGGERIRKVTPTTVTVYLGDLYERVTHLDTGVVEHRYHVSSSERTVAVVTRSAGTTSQQYLHVDNLGSIDVVTNGAGAQIERRSYDPFGARRNPAWGAPGPWSPTASTTLGFTGHEADDELGLINMRGRIYDPAIGRFLTTDPIVSQPLNGQSWNPYAYVLNNPLAYVDPSGFDAETMPGFPFPPEEIVSIGDLSEEVDVVAPSVEPDGWELPEGYGIVWPTDGGTWGSPVEFQPAPLPVSERRSQSAWDVAMGVLRGAAGAYAEDVVDTAISTVMMNPLNPFMPAYAMYQGIKLWTGLSNAAYEGYQADGVVGFGAGILNTFNPLYQLGVGLAATVVSAEKGDYEAAGAHGFRFTALAVTTIVGAGFAGAGGGPRGTLAEGASSRIVPGGGLTAHEAAGGHLIAKHVGKTQADLSARLLAEPKIGAASTFLSRAEAEAAVSNVLDARAADVNTWLSRGARGKLILDEPFSGGMVVNRGASVASKATQVRLVLRNSGPGGWHIVTGYPMP